MIDKISLWRFLSGRLVGLGLLLGFQVVIVRLLPATGYARYALVIALASLLQTVTSLGIPRVLAKFVSGAGVTVDAGAAKTLSLAMLGARLMAGLLVLAVGALAARWLKLGAGEATGSLAAGAAYALTGALLIDADALAQALGLQIASRRAAIGEPAARLLLVLGLAFTGGRDVAAVLWISAATSAGAAAALVGAAVTALSARTGQIAGPALDWREVRRAAVGGYGGTLSWLALSPAVIRLIAARVLPLEAFAGFSFVQTLAVSAQRYAPSFTLFPLVEPAAMADAARTGRPDRLGAALSLLVKLDALVVGAAIVVACAVGAPVLLILTHGRYGAAAAYLPWLLAGIIANASHRSYEIAAISLGAASALTRALVLTLIWLAVAILAAPRFGVWPLLWCPLGDAVTRLWFIQRALARGDREGAPALIDPRGLGVIVLATAVAGFTAARAADGLHSGLLGDLGAVVAGLGVFVGLSAAFRTIRTLEAAVFPPLRRFLNFFTPSASSAPLRVMVLTPRGMGGTGGVDRLMDGLRPTFGERGGVDVRFVTTRGGRLLTSPLWSILALARLALASALGRVDLIHVNLGARLGCYRKMALIAIPRLLGTPYVLHLHGSAFETFWLTAPRFARRRIDRLFRDAARIIVLGESGRALVASRVPKAAACLTILPNATAPIVRRKDGADQTVQILFLGELGVRKGVSLLIEALGRVETEPTWRAVIAGEGDVAAARRSVEKLGLGDRVRVTGWVAAAEVERLLATSDILALPSFEETLPMALVEAFGVGLAVIATPVGAVTEILKPGETGLMVAPGDVAGLAEAIDALVRDPVLRGRLGAAAKAYHAQHLSLERYTKQLIDLWRRSTCP